MLKMSLTVYKLSSTNECRNMWTIMHQSQVHTVSGVHNVETIIEEYFCKDGSALQLFNGHRSIIYNNNYILFCIRFWSIKTVWAVAVMVFFPLVKGIFLILVRITGLSAILFFRKIVLLELCWSWSQHLCTQKCFRH